MIHKWTVYWSCGPHDNPDDGLFAVEANNFTGALGLATEKLDGDADKIDAIIRTDLLEDMYNQFDGG